MISASSITAVPHGEAVAEGEHGKDPEDRLQHVGGV
jgi:hypothetical protein